MVCVCSGGCLQWWLSVVVIVSVLIICSGNCLGGMSLNDALNIM